MKKKKEEYETLCGGLKFPKLMPKPKKTKKENKKSKKSS